MVLETEVLGWLERPIEEAKTLKVVKGVTSDNYKAPYPDGFSMTFFQTCREVIKDDIM